MAHTVLWIDGFDEIGNSNQKYPSSDYNQGFEAVSSSGTPFSYGRYLRVTTMGSYTSNHWIGPTLPGAPFTALFVSFYLLTYGAYDLNGDFFFEFWDESVPDRQVDIRLFRDPVSGGHRLVLRRGASDIHTWIAARLVYNQWIHVSLKYVANSSSGVVELAVDGESLGAFTGNTLNTANVRVDRFRFRTQTGNYADRVAVDDLVIASGLASDPLLPVSRVMGALMPTANVAVAWTPSSGTNYQTVDEIPPNDSDYNSTSTSGAKDVFSHAAVANNFSQIHAVRVNARAWRDSTDTIENLVRISGTDYYGPTKTPSGTYFSHGHIWQQNPATSTAWTPAEATGAGFGYRRV